MAVPTQVMAATSQVMAAPTLPLLRTVQHSRPFGKERSFILLENVLKILKLSKNNKNQYFPSIT
jgi:hypothetical protein